MNERFDINKKIEHKEYRKTLADELREKIKESGFDGAREYLKNKKEEGTSYDKVKEQKLAQWVINKYLSNPDLFEGQDIGQLSQGDIGKKIYEVKNEIQPKEIKNFNEETKKSESSYEGGGGVSSENSLGVYKRIEGDFIDKKFENDPKIEKFQGIHSDIILQPGKSNKYILLEVVYPKMEKDFADTILTYDEGFKVADLSSFYEKDKQSQYDIMRKIYLDNTKDKFITAKGGGDIVVGVRPLSTIVVARPLTDSIGSGFQEHFQIAKDFVKDRELKDDAEDRFYSRDGVFRKIDKKKGYEFSEFLEKCREIIKDEPDYAKALDKIESLPVPKFEPSIVVRGGGYMNLQEDGSVVIYGSSQKYKQPQKEKIVDDTIVIDCLKEDFPDKKFLKL